jgi:hypothetical protein
MHVGARCGGYWAEDYLDSTYFSRGCEEMEGVKQIGNDLDKVFVGKVATTLVCGFVCREKLFTTAN